MRLAEREAGQGGGLGVTPDQAIAAGTAALDAGEVGVLLVAGGQGSRLGFDKPKGMYPIGPVSGATLLQVHLEKAVALAKRHGAGVPVYLMTSPVTHDDQLAFLAENDNFGLADDDLYVFCQGTMPAVDMATGKLLLADEGSLFLSPDGHGGTIAALSRSGAIDHMRRRGVKHLFYLQVDNPLSADRRRGVPRLPPPRRERADVDGGREDGARGQARQFRDGRRLALRDRVQRLPERRRRADRQTC